MSDSSSSKDANNVLNNQEPPESASTTEDTSTAASPNTATTPAVSVSLREDLTKNAVSFLSSASVQSADRSKKIAFLQKKDLNQAEIDEAFKRVGDNETTPVPTSANVAPSNPVLVNRALAPVLPGRHVQPQVVYYPQPPPPPVPAEKVFAVAVLLGMGAVGVTASVVGILRRFIAPLLKSIADYRRTRYNQRKDIGDKLLESLKNHQVVNDDLDAVIDQGDERSVADALIKHQAELASKIDKVVEQSREGIAQVLNYKTYSDFKSNTLNFKETLSPSDSFGFSHAHYSRNSNHSDSPAVTGLKSDIRSLKAVLLNRRNFPIV